MPHDRPPTAEQRQHLKKRLEELDAQGSLPVFALRLAVQAALQAQEPKLGQRFLARWEQKVGETPEVLVHRYGLEHMSGDLFNALRTLDRLVAGNHGDREQLLRARQNLVAAIQQQASAAAR